jgi:hypothetical protein
MKLCWIIWSLSWIHLCQVSSQNLKRILIYIFYTLNFYDWLHLCYYLWLTTFVLLLMIYYICASTYDLLNYFFVLLVTTCTFIIRNTMYKDIQIYCMLYSRNWFFKLCFENFTLKLSNFIGVKIFLNSNDKNIY